MKKLITARLAIFSLLTLALFPISSIAQEACITSSRERTGRKWRSCLGSLGHWVGRPTNNL